MTKGGSLHFRLLDPMPCFPVAMVDRKVVSSQLFLFFFNLLVVIYNKKFLTDIRIISM